MTDDPSDRVIHLFLELTQPMFNVVFSSDHCLEKHSFFLRADHAFDKVGLGLSLAICHQCFRFCHHFWGWSIALFGATGCFAVVGLKDFIKELPSGVAHWLTAIKNGIWVLRGISWWLIVKHWIQTSSWVLSTKHTLSLSFISKWLKISSDVQVNCCNSNVFFSYFSLYMYYCNNRFVTHQPNSCPQPQILISYLFCIAITSCCFFSWCWWMLQCFYAALWNHTSYM